MTMRFGFSDTFQDSLAKLDRSRQQQVKSAMFDLQSGPVPPGFNLEKLHGQELWSGRVSMDIRMIMHWDGGLNIALYVGPHDDAYAWAANHKFQEHPVTGSMQLFAIEHVTERITEEINLGPRPFERYDDEYLNR